MPGFDHFDWLAPWYDRVISAKSPEKLIELARLPVQGWLLDAGGGTGRVAETLRDQAGAVIVADLSLKMLSQAAEKGGLLPANALSEALPFPDESFEVVLMVDALHHVHDQARTASELFRVLRPGGRLVVEEPDIRRFPVKLVAVAEKLALMRSRFLSPRRMASLFNLPAARVRTEWEGYIAWVVVEKIKTAGLGQ